MSAEPIDLTLLPAGSEVVEGRLHLHGIDLVSMAATYGTPLFVYDEDELRSRARLLQEGFAPGVVAYAGKAFLITAMVELIAETELYLDVASGQELAIAIEAGMPPERIHLHGNAKTSEEIRFALERGIGAIVIDSEREIETVIALAASLGHRAPVSLRITPGVSGETHPAIDTGTTRSKFGVDVASGAAFRAARAIIEAPELEWRGIHAHIGSQVRSIAAFHESAAVVVAFAAELAQHGLAVPEINVGGGFAVRYQAGDKAVPLETFIPGLRKEMDSLLAAAGLPASTRAVIEPGRALVAPAALTLYEVVSTKTTGAGITYVAVNGGMTDNLRPALYGATYEAFLPARVTEPRSAAVALAGKHCEQGDVLIPDGRLPEGVDIGDIVATPVTGAYGYAMASNYNAALRPAVVFVSSAGVRLVRRRETRAELLACDVSEAPHSLPPSTELDEFPPRHMRD